MRLLGLALLLSVLPGVAAQSQFEPSAGLYLVLESLDPVGDDRGAHAAVGWRFGSGTDLGLAVGGRRLRGYETRPPNSPRDADVFRVGVEVAQVFGLPAGLGLRTEGRVQFARGAVDDYSIGALSLYPAGQYDPRTLMDLSTQRDVSTNEGGVGAQIDVFRRVSLGRLRVVPSLRASWDGATWTRTDRGGAFTLRVDAPYGMGTLTRRRFAAALPITADLRGVDVTLDTEVGLENDDWTRQSGLYGRLRLRINP